VKKKKEGGEKIRGEDVWGGGGGVSHLNLGLRSSYLERDFQCFSLFLAGEFRDLNVTLYHAQYGQCLSQFTTNVTHNYQSKIIFT